MDVSVSPPRTQLIFHSIHTWVIEFTIFELEYRNGWLIRTTTKSFAVYAATSTEKQEWMAHINKCIEDLLRKSKFKLRNGGVFRLSTLGIHSNRFLSFHTIRRRQETSWTPCCRLGARQRSQHLYALQAHAIHNAPEKGKPTHTPPQPQPFNDRIFYYFSASLSELWRCRVRTMLIEEVLITVTEYKTCTRLSRLLRFAEPV